MMKLIYITNCTLSNKAWYKNYVNQVFEYEEIFDEKYGRIAIDEMFTDHYVLCGDAIEIKINTWYNIEKYPLHIRKKFIDYDDEGTIEYSVVYHYDEDSNKTHWMIYQTPDDIFLEKGDYYSRDSKIGIVQNVVNSKCYGLVIGHYGLTEDIFTNGSKCKKITKEKFDEKLSKSHLWLQMGVK